MFEIEKMESEFDYSLVDNDTADFLRSCEYEINGIAEDARVKFGTVLIKAKEKLSNGKYGIFRQWHESGGISKDDANYFMNLSSMSRNLDHKESENFLKAPKTVQKKVMQKNTPQEIKDAVHQGEVTTNKQLMEMEKRLKEQAETIKQRESQLQTTQHENELLHNKLEKAENIQPEIKTVYKEKVPKYIEEQMRDKEQELIDARKEKEEAEKRYAELERKHKETYRRDHLTEDEQLGSRRFQAENNMLEMIENMDEFLSINAVNSFKQGAIAHSSERTRELINERIEELEEFCRAMRSALNNKITIN